MNRIGSLRSNDSGEDQMEQHLEFPFPEGGSLHTRPLGIVQANGSLMFSEGGHIPEEGRNSSQL